MEKSEFVQAIEHYTDGLTHLSVGVCSSCSDCQESHGFCCEYTLEHAIEHEGYSDEGSFSWSYCDTCGSHLGGNRYDAHAFLDEKLIHLSVCVDCLMYIANGDEPENWKG